MRIIFALFISVYFCLGFSIAPASAAFDPYSVDGQVLAEATCTAINPRSGWTFAVGRSCNSETPDCESICRSLSEDQGGNLEAFNSLHIYSNSPFDTTQEN